MDSQLLKQRILKLVSERVPIAQLAREIESATATILVWVRESFIGPVQLKSERDQSSEIFLWREVKCIKEVNQILENATDLVSFLN